jgi:hypothetical protein
MKTILRSAAVLARLVAVTALLGGCDPEGPGAKGTISIDPSVDPSGFATLQIRAYPDSEKDFDPAKMPATSNAQQGLALSQVTFPHFYDVGEGVGTSDSSHWRMVAWLSHDVQLPAKPAAADPLCSAPFDLKACSAGFGGYCTVAGDVDCIIK